MSTSRESKKDSFLLYLSHRKFFEKLDDKGKAELTGLAKAFYLLFNEITELNESLDEIYD